MVSFLRPSFTLDDLFGMDTVYCQRISPTTCTWLPFDESQKDMMTGGALTISGDMPHICSAAVSTPAALNLLKGAGLPTPESGILRYHDKDDYIRLLKSLCKSGRKVATQYLHSEFELSETNYCIKPPVLSFVNNKANLGILVDEYYCPSRVVIPINDLTGYLSGQSLPIVVKAVTDEPTGAGLDVVLCKSHDDTKRAEEIFKKCRYVIVEEFLHISRNYCLNYAVSPLGAITFLGCAEQVSDINGIYQGNWLGKEIEAPDVAIDLGKQIVQKGFSLGYFGLVGIDLAILEDGQIKVFDLNFRINGSTTATLLAKSVIEAFGQPLIRLSRFMGAGSFCDMLKIVYKEMEKGKLIPIASYDPTAVGNNSAQPRLIALVLGETKDDIEEYKITLETMGLSKTTYRKDPR